MKRTLLALLVAITGGLLVAAEPTPVAHRGLFKHAPENTLPAFAAAADLRLGFELDVRRTKDGHLVVVHDETLKRTTGDLRKVADVTLAELKRLDPGAEFHPVFARVRVPTLDEVFTLMATRRPGPTVILLDLKIEDEALPGELAALVAKHGFRDRVVCIGTAIESPAVRRRLKDADSKLPVAVLANKPEDFPAAVKDAHSDWAYLRFVPTAEQVAAARAAGKRVLCVGPLFAGNEPENWKKAAAAGVDAILTDYPLEMRAALRGKAGDRQ